MVRSPLPHHVSAALRNCSISLESCESCGRHGIIRSMRGPWQIFRRIAFLYFRLFFLPQISQFEGEVETPHATDAHYDTGSTFFFSRDVF